MKITITDKVGTSGTVTVDKDDAAQAIRPWYSEDWTEAAEVIDTLQTALNRGESTYGLEEALGIEIVAAGDGDKQPLTMAQRLTVNEWAAMIHALRYTAATYRPDHGGVDLADLAERLQPDLVKAWTPAV